MLNLGYLSSILWARHSSSPKAVSEPKGASKVRVIEPKQIINKCKAKVESVAGPLILALALIAIPIGGYFLHIMNMPAALGVSCIIVLALAALKTRMNSIEDQEKKEKKVRNLPLFIKIVNGVEKIESMTPQALLECLALAPETDDEFFATCKLDPNITYENEKKHATAAGSIIENVEDQPGAALSSISHLGFKEPSKGQILFMNGVLNNYAYAYQSALLISHLSGGYNVHLVHNASHGLLKDLLECLKGLCGILTEPALCLHKAWDLFFDDPKNENAQILQICHSQGAIHVRNALRCYPQKLRERIRVIAIAPGAYIPAAICAEAYHYISYDLVPKVDDEGQKAAKHVLYCKTDNWENHMFNSKIYLGELKSHLDTFIASEAAI